MRCQGPLWQPHTLRVVLPSPPRLACKVFTFFWGGGCMHTPLSLLGQEELLTGNSLWNFLASFYIDEAVMGRG